MKIIIVMLSILMPSTLFCCTGVRLTAKNGAVVYGRTLEFGAFMDSAIIAIPRQYALRGIDPQGKPNGLKWQTSYAVIGTNALGLHEIIDGINEKGLAGGLFYFPDYAGYQTVSNTEISRSLAPWQLMTWILTTCSTVAEVKQQLPTIKVSNAPLPQWHAVQPLHAVVHDPTGNCIVIEYVKGELHIYDNPLGVITNAPTFDWHITNLRNYINLSSVNVPKVTLANIHLTPLGQGSGMLGLPGDFTPPSRFVRAVAFSQTIEQPATEQAAVDAVFHILNLFEIPKGIIKQRDKNAISRDYTQWTSVADTKNKAYYIHTYDNRQIKMINFSQINSAARTVLTTTLESPQIIVPLLQKNSPGNS